MDRLYIITKSEDFGKSYANMQLNLNSGAFKVLTQLSDLDSIPSKGIAITLEPFPMEVMSISDSLKMKGWKIYSQYIFSELITRLYQDFIQATSTHKYTYHHDTAVFDLKKRLESLGFTKDNGFEYTIYHGKDGYVFTGRNQLMDLIINLLQGKILGETSTKFTS